MQLKRTHSFQKEVKVGDQVPCGGKAVNSTNRVSAGQKPGPSPTFQQAETVIDHHCSLRVSAAHLKRRVSVKQRESSTDPSPLQRMSKSRAVKQPAVSSCKSQ